MPVWREKYPGVESAECCRHGLHRQRPWREQACRYRHLAARHRRNACRPVFIDGKKAMTLRGPNIASDFEALVADYIEKRFGQKSVAAGDPPPEQSRKSVKRFSVRNVGKTKNRALLLFRG